ncbi:cytochrome P450 306a1 isoform X1 [Diorhabda carinulata]|uniref:cytochrome P450 306a1 isoform X1 n=2 Tax=Diorhabda carinulata TaxID=1163345 RepID=UPI0025A1684A|nr:cytochrome P450 306a1 isoform X1 [Diorhabda carinulata]
MILRLLLFITFEMYLYLIALFVLWITYIIWKNYSLPPGPWGIPIFGYLPWMDPKNPYITLTNLSKKYGSIYGLNLGSVYTVVLTNPKTIKSVFSINATTGRAPLYLTHGIMEGNGLICAEGEVWKEHRRFTFNCIRQLGGAKVGPQRKKMETLILNHAIDFIKYLDLEEDGREVDIFPGLRHSLGSAVYLIVFGKSWSRDDDLWKYLLYLQEEGPKYMGIAGPLNFLPFLRFFPKYQKIMSFIKSGQTKSHNLYKDLIDEQAQLLKKQATATITTNGIPSNDSAIGHNVIQCFLLEKEKKSPEFAEKLYHEKQCLHLLADIFGAGLDTSLTSLRWHFLYLAKNPSVQDEIRKEINDVLHDRLPTMDDIEMLPLLEASILEAMRIRPVVPVGLPHGTLEDIDIDGYKIPKGTMVMSLLWALHMDENAWKNPEEFNPKRFINEEGKVEKNDYFMPFQTGKRMCVGDELARMFQFLFSATILQKFSFSLRDENFDTWGECGITLTPVDHKFIIKKV